MTKSIFATAFLLGASAVIWMAALFIGSDALALTVTVVIGCVYFLGVNELRLFRQSTSTLASALDTLSGSANKPETINNLANWLNQLHPSLQNTVQLRIEGERVALPTPVLTPYLVGLLVMLGLLGTFVGMVDTLQGAVVALEGSSELQAIRAGLAAPIQGLGLAFGTSVAGVAASAMLGLMSTLSRRERIIQTQRLDQKITTVFRQFSLTHNRQETFKALQMQANSLPDVAETLNTMADKLQHMGDQLSHSLIANQEALHQSVKQQFTDLATSVEKSLKDSVAENGRLIGDSIKPILQDTVSEISAELKTSTQTTHQQLTVAAEEQFTSLSDSFKQTSNEVAQAWQQSLSNHEGANTTLIEQINNSVESFSKEFEHKTTQLIESFDKTTLSWSERQLLDDKERLDLWANVFGQAQQQAVARLAEASRVFSNELKQATEAQETRLETVTQDFGALSSSITSQWRDAEQQSLNQQQQVATSLQEAAHNMNNTMQHSSTQMLTEISRLLKSSEDLVQTRIESEASWLNSHGERMNELSSVLKTELSALRNDEQDRGQAAVERLTDLQSAVAGHLATLGQALEAPMTQLIETASETPRAAAEVIEHLRREISNNIERDNTLLKERHRIMEELSNVSDSLQQSSAGQHEAIEKLVNSSTDMLQGVAAQFSDHVDTEATKLSESVALFAGSTTEMSSFGEAFGLAIELFRDSNANLVENLSRIEESLTQSSTRSDEQLGYYVAQARDIIDQSIVSQTQMLEGLRQLNQQDERRPAEVN